MKATVVEAGPPPRRLDRVVAGVLAMMAFLYLTTVFNVVSILCEGARAEHS
jgi:hypothetical protein